MIARVKAENYYTPEDAERFTSYRDTANGIPFDWGLVNADGAWFCLLPTKGVHTEDQIVQAKAALHADRDVVGAIKVVWLEPAADNKTPAPDSVAVERGG